MLARGNKHHDLSSLAATHTTTTTFRCLFLSFLRLFIGRFLCSVVHVGTRQLSCACIQKPWWFHQPLSHSLDLLFSCSKCAHSQFSPLVSVHCFTAVVSLKFVFRVAPSMARLMASESPTASIVRYYCLISVSTTRRHRRLSAYYGPSVRMKFTSKT